MINYRIHLFIALFIAGVSFLDAKDERPNILFLFTDDQPQSCLGIAGNKEIKTPHLDHLAQRGTFFDNAFVTMGACLVTMACLASG